MPSEGSLHRLADSERERYMLEQLRELLLDGSPLNGDEKQLLAYLLWLLGPADEIKRQKALARLVRLSSHRQMDRATFVHRVNQIILEFEPIET